MSRRICSVSIIAVLTIVLAGSTAAPVCAQFPPGPVDGPGLPIAPPPDWEPVRGTDALPPHWNMISEYQDVPEYTWYYGCSPTAAGMLFGWWDAQPGTQNLFDGDASTFWGDSSESPTGGTKGMVAATQHIVAGSENGHTYGDWHDCTSYPNHESNPASLGDFMKTVDGSTSRSNMAAGFEAFSAWDAPWTSVNESYADVDATTYYTYGGWDFDDFKAELEAGRPVHLGITGHSILALGWWDQSTVGDPNNYGYICYTTWSGWELTEWRWDGVDVPNERAVYGATYLTIVPEPASMLLLLVSAVSIVGRRGPRR